MKVNSLLNVLLVTGAGRVAAIDALQNPSQNPVEDSIPSVLENRDGWVNPEDLIPMPQCIAQQDTSNWLSAMTKCTEHRCTAHFLFICTHYQWLTELSCLNTELSPGVVKEYVPYCSRSVLAKAQLYDWIESAAGRNWLVEVGDVSELYDLSPNSLVKGYAEMDTIHLAPTCLVGSRSGRSAESFGRVLESCSFTGTTQHAGNAARPWEYQEPIKSMAALDFETVGYSLTGSRLGYGHYFDKECFCSTFTIDEMQEPCPDPDQIELTKERLWLSATCGSSYLPANWTESLKVVGSGYIPVTDWHWPSCVMDTLQESDKLMNQYTTEACELDSRGYCGVVKTAVDTSRFCQNIDYDHFKSSCHIFENRIHYINWLRDICGDVQDWDGLPDNWPQLVTPSVLEMIPWDWTLKPHFHSRSASKLHSGSTKKSETCPSNGWKIASLAFINVAAFLCAFVCQKQVIGRLAGKSAWNPSDHRWFVSGIIIATTQLIANFVNALVLKNTSGYGHVPVVQLVLLWCLMPRSTWFSILPIYGQSFETEHFSATMSSLVSEVILQSFSAYYMFSTFKYGAQHSFYSGRLEDVEKGQCAILMYVGALLWLFITAGALIHFICIIFSSENSDYSWSDETRPLKHQSRSQQRSRSNIGRKGYGTYGTVPIETKVRSIPRKVSMGLYLATTTYMALLWVAQWLFWVGFIRLSSDEFCPPFLWILTVVWMMYSLIGAIVRTII